MNDAHVEKLDLKTMKYGRLSSLSAAAFNLKPMSATLCCHVGFRLDMGSLINYVVKILVNFDPHPIVATLIRLMLFML